MASAATHGIRRQGTTSKPARELAHGTVEAFSLVTGFGNIRGDNGCNYFIHQMDINSTLTRRGLRAFRAGQRVTFRAGKNKDGKRDQAYSASADDWTPINVQEVDTWLADNGTLHVNFDGRNGNLIPEADPTFVFGDSVCYLTEKSAKQFSFRLPNGARVSALGLDKQKNVVPTDQVPFDGFVLFARDRGREGVEVTIYRFGKRHDENWGDNLNIMVVEKRLKMHFCRIPDKEYIERQMEAEFAGHTLLPYNKDFIPAMLRALQPFG